MMYSINANFFCWSSLEFDVELFDRNKINTFCWSSLEFDVELFDRNKINTL